MRVALATIGSRGDVEPFVQLAAALAARDHEVTLALDAGYRRSLPSLARASHPRLTVASLGALASDEMIAAVARAVAAPTPVERSRAGYDGFIGERRTRLRDRLIELASAHDLLVIGDALAFIENGRLPWTAPTAILWYTLGPESEYQRLRAIDCLRLAALPARLAPRDPALAASVQFAGLWRAAAGEPLSTEILAFLARGPAPLFLTMGSMAGFDARALVTRFIAAARANGWRAIIQRGWAELDAQAADDVLVTGELDYARLFPRCAALFTHGGAGTIGQALLAGKPIALLPLVEDQLAWGRVVSALGSSLGTIDPRAADAAAFNAAMQRARDPSLTQAATQTAQALAAEGGLPAACDALESYVKSTMVGGRA